MARVSGDSPEGVIVAHGGSAVGYALHSDGEKAVFSVRHGNNEAITRVKAALPNTTAKTTEITASLEPDGTLKLKVGAGVTVSKASPGLLERHPQEDLSVGHDTRNPVDPASLKPSFSGKIDGLEIKLAPGKK